MKNTLLLFQLLFSTYIVAQNGVLNDAILDSLATRVNETEGEFQKSLELEKVLNLLAVNDSPNELLTERLDPSKFNKRMFLYIDAYEARRVTYQGDWDKVNRYKESKNPYVLFYVGNIAFQNGEESESIRILNMVSKEFIALNDSFYTSSTFNNIGASMWHQNKEDSALHYFLNSKEYTYWFNPMLESNILAISNIIEDSALSASQIRNIKTEQPEIDNPVFYNNAHQHYLKFDSAKADSLVNFLIQRYPDSTVIPDILLSVFMSFDVNRKQLALSFDSASYNSYLVQGANKLVLSEVIVDSFFSSERLDDLRQKLDGEPVASLIGVFSELDSTKRRDLVAALQAMEYARESNLEAEAIKELYTAVKQEFVEYKSNDQKVAVVSVIFALIVFVLLQRRALNASQKARGLAKENTELLEIQVQNLSMGNKVRDKIQESLTQQIQFSKKLQELTEHGAEHKTALMQDLNLINTYNKGVNRFKIKQICGEFYSPRFVELEGTLNALEMQVLKLTILEFKSKEIALLLDVTPQYVNNIRHRIKTALEKGNIQYDQLISELTDSLIEA